MKGKTLWANMRPTFDQTLQFQSFIFQKPVFIAQVAQNVFNLDP